jgi:hypothetical protein
MNHNSGRPVWKQYGDDAAQLFRDFFFGKYTETTAPNAVFTDPDRPYRFYNRTSFYRHVKNTCNRVKTFKQFGTGIDNPEFKNKLRLTEAPSPEERGAVGLLAQRDDDNNSQFNSDEDDETFRTQDGNEEDVALPRTFEIESFLGNLSIQEEDHWPSAIEDNKLTNKKKEQSKMNIGSDNCTDFNNDLGVKYLVHLPDGRLCAIVYLPSGFDGHFKISEDGKKVIMKTKIPKVMISAERCFSKLGLGKQDAFVVHMQSKMNELLETYKKAGVHTDGNKVFNEKVIFKLPFEVKRTFFDERGDEDHKCQIGEYDNVEWAYFFMVNANVQKMASPEPRMARDRSRRRESSNNNNNISNYNNNSNLQTSLISGNTNRRSTRQRADEDQFHSPRMYVDTADDQFTEEVVSDDDYSL